MHFRFPFNENQDRLRLDGPILSYDYSESQTFKDLKMVQMRLNDEYMDKVKELNDI